MNLGKREGKKKVPGWLREAWFAYFYFFHDRRDISRCWRKLLCYSVCSIPFHMCFFSKNYLKFQMPWTMVATRIRCYYEIQKLSYWKFCFIRKESYGRENPPIYALLNASFQSTWGGVLAKSSTPPLLLMSLALSSEPKNVVYCNCHRNSSSAATFHDLHIEYITTVILKGNGRRIRLIN